MDAHAEEMDRHVKNYIAVFVALMFLTLTTIGAWYFLELSVGATIAVAMFIAIVKGSLVACVFMHLISEKKLIFSLLLVTVAFFFVLLLVPMFTSIADQVRT